MNRVIQIPTFFKAFTMIRPIFSILVLFLFSNLTYADNASGSKANYGNSNPDESSAGFIGGMAIGAAAGGPPGAVAGAIVGAFLGDGWGAKKQVNNLQVHLVNTRFELAALQEETELLRKQYALATQGQQTATARVIPARLESVEMDACCDNTVMSVYFRTGSAAIEEHDRDLISSFANLSRNISNPLIEITGYADRNGDADSNLQLSRQRTQEVKGLLAQLGIENSSITTIAHGESQPLRSAQDFESDFFDRRVILRLRDASKVTPSTSDDISR
jgi:sortase system peptidoglycan-associated protein